MNSAPPSGSHQEYQDLVENLSVGVYRNTPGSKGRFLEANSAIVAMFEADSKEEFMKHSVSDLYQDPKERAQFVQEIMKKGSIKNREVCLVTLKGKKIIGSVTAVMQKDGDGNVFFDGIVEDISKHKRKESELIRHHKAILILVERKTQELREVNKKLSSEIADRKIAQNSLLASNEKLENTKQAMLNIMEDLESAKAQMEFEKARDEAMLASIGEGLIAADNEGNIVIMNRAAENMLGWKAKEMVGQVISNLPLEDEAGNCVPMNQRPTFLALTTGSLINSTYYFVRKDKTKFPIAINVTPIKLGEKIIGTIDIFRDTTREKEVDRAKSEFVSLASHQLCTPLGISKWYIEAMMEEEYFHNAPQSTKDYCAEVYKNNGRLLDLVRSLLSVSRIDQGRVKNAPQLVNIAEIVKTVVKEMKILAFKNKIALHLALKKTKIPDFYIDTLRVQEVIENLLTNAIVYSNSPGAVHISIEQKNDSIVIAVRDAGIGISSEDRKKLFTKFFRSENAVIKNTDGSGLGLYVVKSYVEGWGGNLHVKSSPGKGSTFTVTLPLKTEKGEKRKVVKGNT